MLSACGGESPSTPGGSKADGASYSSNFDGPPVVVVGMDGLEWSVMKPLLDAGKLPNFNKLIQRGMAGGLTTFQPTFSPVVWTSIATGMPREKHGILYFSEMQNGRALQNGLPYTSNSRKTPAVWNILSDQGRDVLAVGWWVSWPAEEVNGRIMSSYAAQAQGKVFWKAGVWEEPLPQMTWPDELMMEVFPHLEAGAPDGPVRAEYEEFFNRIPGEVPDGAEARMDPWHFPRGRDAFFRVSYHADRTHLEIFKEQLELRASNLNMVYFGLPDVAGHFWWRYREPGAYQYPIPTEHVGHFQKYIDQSYIAMDGFLAEIVEKAPSDARIMVVSDHGMHAGNFNNPNNPQSGLHEDAPPGVLIVAGPGIRAEGLKPTVEWRYQVMVPMPGGRMQQQPRILQAPESIGGVYDITPTLLDWLGISTAQDMAGRSLRDLMDSDWLSSNPLRTVPTHSEGFRAATPPLEPRPGLNEVFKQGVMEQLGYADSAAAVEGLDQARKD